MTDKIEITLDKETKELLTELVGAHRRLVEGGQEPSGLEGFTMAFAARGDSSLSVVFQDGLSSVAAAIQDLADAVREAAGDEVEE